MNPYAIREMSRTSVNGSTAPSNAAQESQIRYPEGANASSFDSS
jgi:hypothetical protein